ncbi:MAG: ABC transporter ATP-binding protein, partial [Acidimicrobiia bacterium]|nr:ABC transporter ATP-binding protein [Acidimicrobiia bacterium]
RATVAEQIDAQARATRAVATVTAFRSITVVLGGWVPVVLILVAGPWLLDRGATAGAIIGALFYVLQGVQPALQSLVEELGGSGLWLLVTLDRLAETASSPDPIASARPAARVGRWQPEGHEVRLSGVTFRYGPSAEPVIARLDMVIPEGDHLVVVGPSGAGKSTLAGLISGLLAAEAGEVCLGGVPVGHLDTATLAGLRVLIPQEAYVFAGTLGENLAYLNPDVARGPMDHAVDLLGASELVERLGGYDAELRPSSLSAGERQLLTLVRAYLSPAPIVVLDEATCHLDPAAEAMVEVAFVTRPGTLIIIAHRISSALRAERILVLDGSAANLGTHEALLDESPLYCDLMGHWV